MKGISLVALIITIVVLLILAGAAISFLAGSDYFKYSNSDFQGGIVMDKQYRAQYIDYKTQYIGNDTVRIPYVVPGSYRIQVKKEIDGEVRTRWIEVDKETYHKCGIEDFYEI